MAHILLREKGLLQQTRGAGLHCSIPEVDAQSPVKIRFPYVRHSPYKYFSPFPTTISSSESSFRNDERRTVFYSQNSHLHIIFSERANRGSRQRGFRPSRTTSTGQRAPPPPATSRGGAMWVTNRGARKQAAIHSPMARASRAPGSSPTTTTRARRKCLPVFCEVRNISRWKPLRECSKVLFSAKFHSLFLW